MVQDTKHRRESINIGRIVSGLTTLTTAFPRAQSDWIRYGLPAVMLTVIFFFAIRYESNTAEAPSMKQRLSGAKTAQCECHRE